ncbi:MAG: hypothetical protein JWO74_3501 [Solirubrobacterales bacterium]|nr:hypothetical protein [Solirubrobacterales bacterium]
MTLPTGGELGLVVVVIAWLVAPTGAQARSCAAPGSRVAQAAGQARVFQHGVELYACRLGQRVRIGYTINHLPDEPCNAPASLITLQPRYVAWLESASCHEQSNWLVHVVPLTADGNRRRVLKDGNATCAAACTDLGVGPATALALTPGGSVAWIATDAHSNDGSREVWKAPAGQPGRRLARAADIDRRFLTWTDSVVGWRQGGTLHRG